MGFEVRPSSAQLDTMKQIFLKALFIHSKLPILNNEAMLVKLFYTFLADINDCFTNLHTQN